jgi:hypothetical protein
MRTCVVSAARNCAACPPVGRCAQGVAEKGITVFRSTPARCADAYLTPKEQPAGGACPHHDLRRQRARQLGPGTHLRDHPTAPRSPLPDLAEQPAAPGMSPQTVGNSPAAFGRSPHRPLGAAGCLREVPPPTLRSSGLPSGGPPTDLPEQRAAFARSPHRPLGAAGCLREVPHRPLGAAGCLREVPPPTFRSSGLPSGGPRSAAGPHPRASRADAAASPPCWGGDVPSVEFR